MREVLDAPLREGYAVQNEATRYGERIATLEARFIELVQRLDHLDGCLDEAKGHAASNFESIKEKLATWDSRLKIAIGVVIGVTIAAGSGTVSLKSLIDLIGKLSGH